MVLLIKGKSIRRLLTTLTTILMSLSVMSLLAQGTNSNNTNQNGYTLLQLLPFITFGFALFTGALNLYVVNKLGRTKEEVLGIVRAELKAELQELEKDLSNSTKEKVDNLKTELLLNLKLIEMKIDNSARRDEYIDQKRTDKN